MAIEIGCTFAIVRTMNPIQVNNLTSVFGIGNVVEVYSNPHDIQADRRYYLIRLGE